MPTIPPKEALDEIVPQNIRLTRRLWTHLDRIAKSEGRSRNEVITYFLQWCCDDYDRLAKEQHKGKK